MNELMIGRPHVAALGFRDDAPPTLQDDAAPMLERREPPNNELAAALRQAAEQGWLASRGIVRLVASRIEEAELALLSMSRKLP